MYDLWSRLPSASSEELAYREERAPVVAVVFLLLGGAGAIGTAAKLVGDWPNDWGPLACGLAFCLILMGAGLRAACVRDVRFVKSPPRVEFVIGLLSWRRERVCDLASSGVVTCERGLDRERPSDGEPSYQISLTSSDPDAPRVHAYSHFDHEVAAGIGREIAAFFEWPFDDLSPPGEAADVPSLRSLLSDRSQLGSVLRTSRFLAGLGSVVAACGAAVTFLAHLAGLCDIGQPLGWAAGAVIFLLMRVVLSVACRWTSRSPRQADA
ncbi:MAG: hypothetical protein H0T47_08985 [Planctomycetaceae bacterium]|nr:hypothetical protein [Planctomycetaceae bacterium]